MALVNKQDVVTAAQLDKVGLGFTADLLMQASGINKLNALYDRLSGKDGLEFLDAAFDDLNVRFDTHADELKHIPREGAFIIVSNHPFGMLDGMMLVRLIAGIRPDFKVMANFLLQKIEPIARYFIYVDPFEGEDIKKKNIQGIKTALQHLRSGAPLGIFPAGEVSTTQSGFGKVRDKAWHSSIIKLISKASVPVVPVYFHGTNRRIFHLIGKIHPTLRTATIPAELFTRRKEAVRIRVGAPVTAAEQQKFASADELGRYLRAMVYALGAPLSQRKPFQQRLQALRRPRKIVDPVDPLKLRNEIAGLRHRLLTTRNDYEVYLAPAAEVPVTLRELGRLREVTYRKVGEGTNRSIDLDDFDAYYDHLFLWDKSARRIIGGYRLGRGDDIFARHGKDGFYTATLFQYDAPFVPYLKNTLELGRSFVVEEYQRKAFPLFMLWKGIEKFLSANRQYTYLLGPVSISNSYSELAQALIIRFIKKFYYDEELAAMVHAKKAFAVTMDEELGALLDHFPVDMNELDKLVSEIEPSHYKVPVLLKKYIKQNARIIGFNIDRNFNNCVDGLMILDLRHLPDDTAYSESAR